MGKRTKTTTIIREAPDEIETERPKAIDEDIGEQSYSTFVSRFQGSQGCRVKVYRITPRGRQYCFSGSPEEIESEETIRLYHAEQPYAHEEGNYMLYVTVNGELRDPFPINIGPQVKTHVSGAPSGGMAVVSPEVAMLRDQLNRLEMKLSVQDKPPMLEMVDGLAKLDQLRGGNNGGMSLDTITRCIEIGTRMNGGGPTTDGGWEGMFRDVLKENAPALIGLFQMITRKLQEPAQPAQQIQPQPAAQAAQPTTAGVDENMKPEEQERLMLQQAIVFLKKKALAHSDPGLYVDLIVDSREDPLYARLISEISDNDFSAFASKYDPDMEKPEFREFFSFVHDRIRRVFKPKDTVATASGGEHGNKSDTPSNGATGKSGGK